MDACGVGLSCSADERVRRTEGEYWTTAMHGVIAPPLPRLHRLVCSFGLYGRVSASRGRESVVYGVCVCVCMCFFFATLCDKITGTVGGPV